MANDLSPEEQTVADTATRWLSRYADTNAVADPDPATAPTMWLLSDDGLRRMLTDCVAALDLPGRDARIRAQVAEETDVLLTADEQQTVGNTVANIRWVLKDALTALDLPARDARIHRLARAQVAEEIAAHLCSDADDEARRPGRVPGDHSHVIEEWLREAAAIARKHATEAGHG